MTKGPSAAKIPCAMKSKANSSSGFVPSRDDGPGYCPGRRDQLQTLYEGYRAAAIARAFSLVSQAAIT
jgi:hypothetical protein